MNRSMTPQQMNPSVMPPARERRQPMRPSRTKRPKKPYCG